MAIELVCYKLKQQAVGDPRSEISRVLKDSHLPKPNISKNRVESHAESQRGQNRLILTTDKGVAIMVMEQTRLHG